MILSAVKFCRRKKKPASVCAMLRLLTIGSIAVSLFPASAEIPPLRGVAPDLLEKYVPDKDGNWKCLGHPEIVLHFDQVNDDYCDCPDGSDEPGTAACENGKFYCANEGFEPNFIPTFLVDDGVCDYKVCCDGSDEKSGKCPNRCLELAEKAELLRLERKARLENGLKAKRDLIVQSQNKLREISQRRAELEKTIQLEQQQLNYLNEQDPNDSALRKEVDPQLEKVVQILKVQKDEILLLKTKADSLERLLKELEKNYNPNFNDAAVKAAVQGFRDYSSNSNDDSYSDLDSVEPENIVKDIQKTINTFAFDTSNDSKYESIWSFWKEVLADKIVKIYQEFTAVPLKTASKPLKPISGTAQEIQKSIDSHNKEIVKIDSDLENSESRYGLEDIFRAYDGRCFVEKIGDYDYEYCFTGSLTQISSNGQRVSIGTRDKIEVLEDEQSVGGYSYRVYYEKGAKCWNGPVRKAIAVVQCGDVEQLVSVSEPEKCEYHLVVRSPVGCFSEDNVYLVKEIAEGESHAPFKVIPFKDEL